MNDEFREVKELLRLGDNQKLAHLTKQLLDSRVPAQRILSEGLIPGMGIIGELMKNGEMYLPDVLQSAGAMKSALAILNPLLQQQGIESSGKIVLGTVKGDMHDIGKNLVGIMLQGAGMEVIDLGVNVPPEKYLEAIQTHKPHVVGLSALLTTTMMTMKKTIEVISNAGARDQVKIIVGGAPVNDRFAAEIGADAYARDAASAVGKVKELITNNA